MPSKKKNTSRGYWTTVTPFSKIVAAILFIALPILGFIFGMQYQQQMDEFDSTLNSTTMPTVIKRAKISPTPGKMMQQSSMTQKKY